MGIKLVVFSIAFSVIAACKPAQQSADVSSQQDLDTAAKERAYSQSLKALRADMEKPIGAICGIIPGASSYAEAQRDYEEKLKKDSAEEREKRQFKFDLAKLLHETKAIDVAAWATFAKASQIGDKITDAAVRQSANALQAYLTNPKIRKTEQAAKFIARWGSKAAVLAKHAAVIPHIAVASQAIQSVAERAAGVASKVVGGIDKTGSILQGAAAAAVRFRFVFQTLNVAMWAYSDVIAGCNIASLAFAIMDTNAAQADLKAAEAKMRDIDPKYCCAMFKRNGRWPDSSIAACTEQRRNPSSCTGLSLD